MTYETVDLERYSDFEYLRSCGLNAKRVDSNNKQCKVPSSQFNMAEEFIRGRRLAETIRDMRRNQQKRIDRIKAFQEL